MFLLLAQGASAGLVFPGLIVAEGLILNRLLRVDGWRGMEISMASSFAALAVWTVWQLEIGRWLSRL